MKKILVFSFLFSAVFLYGQETETIEPNPCMGTHGLIVNFDKITNGIVETPCDSLVALARYIKAEKSAYVIIGICTNRNDPSNKKRAKKRAKKVKKALAKLGVKKSKMHVQISYFKAPKKDEHHDWPFYPEKYTYEIGVYLEQDY